MQPVRALDAGDDAGELGRMALRTSRNRRVRLRDSTAAGIDHVDTREHAAAQVGMGRVDARVEQRDRDAGAVETRNLEIGNRRRQHAALLGGLRRICDPHRVDAHDLAVAIEQRGGRGIQTGREAVDHAGIAVLGGDPRPDRSEPGEELLLLRDGSSRPRAHLRFRRSSSSASHPRRQRRRPEQDDVALRRRDGRAHPENALPTRLVDGLRRLPSCALPPATPSVSATTAVANVDRRLRNGRIRIEVTVTRVWKRLDVP